MLITITTCDLFAQAPDSIRWLNPITIQTDKLTTPDKTSSAIALDTSSIAKITSTTLADQLGREGNLFVKSYGPGSLATLSIQGTSASHVGLKWNGFDINNPSLGLYDLSLIPTFLLDNATLIYSGNGASFGSGAIGGALQLTTSAVASKAFSVQVLTGAGSARYFQNGLQIAANNGIVATKTRLYMQHAVNNYSYTTPEGKTANQHNAAFHQNGVSQDLAFQLKGSTINVHGWYLQNDHLIPPIMLVPVSKQEQKDESLRFSGDWELKNKFADLMLSSGYIIDKIHFTDGVAKIDALSSARSWQSSAEATKKIDQRFTTILKAEWNHSYGETDGYKNGKYLDQFSAVMLFRYARINKNLIITGMVRKTYHNGSEVPFIPSIQSYWKFTKALALRVAGAEVYRIPTLNDRFWQPGGNENLLPEEGEEFSTALVAETKVNHFTFSLDAGVFYSKINNQIVWVPGANGLYGAENVHQVESKGTSATFRLKYSGNKTTVNLTITPQYNESVILKSSGTFVNAIGKQQMYTPRELLKGMLKINYRVWSVSCYYNQTGERFTTPDHNAVLPTYSTTDVVLAYEKRYRKISLTLTFSANNIFDENYQVLAWRAMPGRNYQSGLLLGFGK